MSRPLVLVKKSVKMFLKATRVIQTRIIQIILLPKKPKKKKPNLKIIISLMKINFMKNRRLRWVLALQM